PSRAGHRLARPRQDSFLYRERPARRARKAAGPSRRSPAASAEGGRDHGRRRLLHGHAQSGAASERGESFHQLGHVARRADRLAEIQRDKLAAHGYPEGRSAAVGRAAKRRRLFYAERVAEPGPRQGKGDVQGRRRGAEEKSAMKEIGVIGLGNAGKPLALRLIDKGYRLRAFDLNTQVMDEVAQRGAAKVISSADAVAEVTLTVLPSSVEVKAAIFGAAGVLASLKQGRTLIDLSGTDPSFTRVLAEEAEKRRAGFLGA